MWGLDHIEIETVPIRRIYAPDPSDAPALDAFSVNERIVRAQTDLN
jgi:hypothetical protein